MNTIAEVEKLRLKFTGGESLLFKDLSSSFYKGEKVLLLGPSGCGKSTLLQVLSGIIPNSIEVPMKAEKITTPGSWGYVFQDPDTQFCMPFVDEEIAFVLENLEVPRTEMKRRILDLLTQVGLHFDDIHTNISTLSGGMKQRLAIASVLALDPDVLFLDEPTAMLDPQGTIDIWETIKKIGEEKTLIIVEHKIDHVLEFIDRIILFNADGEMIADGKKEEVLSQYKDEMKEHGIWYPGVWEDYLNLKDPINPTTSNVPEKVLNLSEFKGYRGKQEKIAVEHVDVYSGEWIVVKGENGAGKSTLLHALMQFIKTKGHYEIKDIPIKKVKKLTDEMTFVFQNPEFQFVTNSVFEEIAFSLRLNNWSEKEIELKVEELLTRFQLVKHRTKHPYQLSMGQKRRLSVAASIVMEQKIMLLDEPTFGQDSKNTFALLEMIEADRLKGSIIIMVTHDEYIMDHFATRLWTIHDGKLIGDEVIERSKQKVSRPVLHV
ncbi:ABC transporter ATP-binding protein [Litchfieldia salsa]|uniref:Energy-coupling factor transport system ATP-binding protein n=1 Tax=Litchfieldia salsa TaxID=930152 RepID=A0A1H0UYA6_9BACI|nr:ATP-binding cassette domain-containing protein [Litchfieldia salsa]SDP71134.1 energy-coupling factor transport system ATP-binding protein [Litchfieldia salsa]